MASRDYASIRSALIGTKSDGSQFILSDDDGTPIAPSWNAAGTALLGPDGNEVPIAGTSCEAFGASPSASAAVNTAAIQAALDVGGLVNLITPGVYQVNDTHILYDDTHLCLGAGVELQAVTGGPRGSSTFTIFENEHCNSTPVALTSITPESYGTMMVSCTAVFEAAHGCAVGDVVQIKGDGFNIYNGIWQVESVSTTTVANDTLTFLMSKASGSTNVPPTTAAAVASSSQTEATPGVFTTAANTYVAGQAVTITGTPPGGFSNGTVYYVISAGLTSTTLQLADSPFATTGKQVTSSSACTIKPTYYGAPANQNITISGGKINGNFVNGAFNASTTYEDHAIILRRVNRPKVKEIEFRDIKKYCVMLQDTVNPEIYDVEGTSSSDCIKIYGPSWNPKIHNINGTFGDDICSLQPIDGSSYLAYMLGSGFDRGGDIWNGTFSELRPFQTHNSGVVVFYPNGNSGAAGATNEIYRIRGTQNIYGSSAQSPYYSSSWYGGESVTFGNGYVGVTGQVENVICHGTGLPKIDNNAATVGITIQSLVVNNPVAIGQNRITVTPNYIRYATVNNYTINNPNVEGAGASGTAWLAVNGANATVNNLTINGGNFRQSATGQLSVVHLVGGGTVKNLTYTGTRFVGASGMFVNAVSANGSGTLGEVVLVGCVLGAYSRALTTGQGVFTGTPTLKVFGGIGETNYQNVADLTSSQSANIWLNGFSGANAAAGVFNFYGTPGTVNLYISGLSYSGTLFANANGTLSMYNPDGTCPIDLSKLTRNAGQSAKSTGNGTIVANNLCVCDATGAANSWKQLSDTSKTY